MNRPRRHARAVPALLAAALALPAAALASSGGGVGLTPGGSPVTGTGSPTTGTTTGASPSVQSGNVMVSASGDGVTLQTNASGILRKGLTFSGDVTWSHIQQNNSGLIFFGIASLGKPTTMYELKNQDNVLMMLRAQRNW